MPPTHNGARSCAPPSATTRPAVPPKRLHGTALPRRREALGVGLPPRWRQRRTRRGGHRRVRSPA
eukprot:1584742-Lingulodinium_polyedra.AAC.1